MEEINNKDGQLQTLTKLEDHNPDQLPQQGDASYHPHTIENKVEELMPGEQAGFRAGLSIVEQIFKL